MRNYKLRITNYECCGFVFSKLFPHRFRSGFTLIELLISISIFMVFLGIVSTSYMGVVHAQREANAIRKMYSEARNFMEMLAQDVRLGTLDYDCYENVSDQPKSLNHSCPLDVLSLANTSDFIGSDGTGSILVLVNKERTEKIVYWFDAPHHRVKYKKYHSISSDSDWQPEDGYDGPDDNGFRTLLSDDLDVRSLSFAIFPALNPYVHYKETQFQFQPKVTVFLGVQNAAEKNLPPFALHLQTTLSSRVYSRK